MKKLIPSSLFVLPLLVLFNPVKSWGQNVPAPDCGPIFVNQSITTGTTIPVPSATGFDNRTLGCQSWTFMYQANATSGSFTNINFQSTNGAVSPGTFVAWPGTVATGINPNTNQNNAITTFTTGCVSGMACTTDNSWVRLLITRGSFVGRITGVLYGYKTGYSGGGGGLSGGCLGTAATPCVVDGPTAAGAAPTTPPVLVAGQDGAPGSIRTVKTDASGQQIPSNASFAGADGVSNTQLSPTGAGGVQLYTRILPYIFGGTTNDRQFACLFQAVAVVAPGTTGVIITGTMGKTTKICHMHMSTTATGSTLTITSGTGVTCGTGTATIDAYVAGVTSLAMDYTPLSPLKASAAGDDVCYTFSPGNITADITVIYAQI